MGGLLGFRIGMILACFQVLGILLFWSEKLKMSVKALMSCGPICFTSLFEIPSKPIERMFFKVRIASVTIAKQGAVLCRRRSIFLSIGRVGNLQVFLSNSYLVRSPVVCQ